MEHRLPLSRAAIVAAAVAVADRDGLDRLSMRRLGRHFGVEAMSLYNHVPNKAALLDAMVDEALDAIPVPTDPDWRTGLRARCLAQRRVLHDHRWALGVVDSRGTPGPATLRRHDATLGYLRAHRVLHPRGRTRLRAARRLRRSGFVLQEQGLTFDAAPGRSGSMLGRRSARRAAAPRGARPRRGEHRRRRRNGVRGGSRPPARLGGDPRHAWSANRNRVASRCSSFHANTLTGASRQTPSRYVEAGWP